MKLKIFFQNHSKVFIFDLEFEFRDLILMEKIPHTPYLCLLLLLNFVVSVSVSVSAESIGQLQFRFRYRAETKMVVSVVHYLHYLLKVDAVTHKCTHDTNFTPCWLI